MANFELHLMITVNPVTHEFNILILKQFLQPSIFDPYFVN